MSELNLPELLTSKDGQSVDSSAAWEKIRRPEVLELFRTHVYGRAPEGPFELSFDVFDEDHNSLDGTAIRKQVAINASTAKGSLRIDLLLYLPPSAAEKPTPIFTLLNFDGNHTVSPDPDIAIPADLAAKLEGRGKQDDPEASRGMKEQRFPISEIVRRGYGIATTYYGSIDPDFHDGFENGIHPLFNTPEERAADSWGAIGAWAWGLSRIMDYFETDPCVDHSKVAVLGHSRLGKTALWAGAQDERFAIVISNDSGCTGAAIARDKEGETVERINRVFPHWFCENYKGYGDRENDLPVDQHMLVALAAPRPVYVASATEDLWACPANEFLSCVHAAPVYELYGLSGLGTDIMPPPDSPINHCHIGYHVRTGKHNLTPYDWGCFMDFADRFWETK